VTEIESVVEPNGVADDIGRESETFFHDVALLPGH
jgi:hypothetical protein